MKKFKFNPTGVCCKEMHISITDDNRIEDVVFIGGCPGNTMGIRALVKGQKVEEVVDRLEGITCGKRGTSCPAQLSKALRNNL